MIDLEEKEIGKILKYWLSEITCSFCGESVKGDVKMRKSRVILFRKHFCKVLNGNCMIKADSYFGEMSLKKTND